jgi:hypothetical protein
MSRRTRVSTVQTARLHVTSARVQDRKRSASIADSNRARHENSSPHRRDGSWHPSSWDQTSSNLNEFGACCNPLARRDPSMPAHSQTRTVGWCSCLLPYTPSSLLLSLSNAVAYELSSSPVNMPSVGAAFSGGRGRCRAGNLEQRRGACARAMASPPLLVNSCSGKMGHATAEAVLRAGLQLVPYTFCSSDKDEGNTVDVSGTPVKRVGPGKRSQVRAA